MSFQSSDFLPIWRNGETYKATTFELQEYLQTGLDFAVSDHNHDTRYVKKTGDTMTGDLNIDKSSGTAIQISKNGSTNLKFWADGSAETTKTTFSNNHFVTKAYVDANAGGTLQKASSTVLGGVKIGSGVNIDSNGKISVSTSYASSGHNHNTSYVKGNFTITKSNGNYYVQ